jgi:hypothetical protein
MALLFSLLSFIPQGMGEEDQLGTVLYTIRFFKLSIFINTLFSLIGIIFGLIAFPRLLAEPGMGLWPMMMCCLVI